MPRKISGIAISVIDASSVASRTASVVLESATHLYTISQRTGNLRSSSSGIRLSWPQPTPFAADLRLVLGRSLRRIRASIGSPFGHGAVLGRLDREGPHTTAALAAAENMRPQSMAQFIAELESEGRHPLSRRAPTAGASSSS